jgi:hypothetical protein
MAVGFSKGRTMRVNEIISVLNTVRWNRNVLVGDPSIESAEQFLFGFLTGCFGCGMRGTWGEYVLAFRKRGWNVARAELVKAMRDRGLSDEIMFEELLAIHEQLIRDGCARPPYEEPDDVITFSKERKVNTDTWPKNYDEWLALSDDEKQHVHLKVWDVFERDGFAFANMAAARLAMQSEKRVLDIKIIAFLGGEWVLQPIVSEADCDNCPSMLEQTFEGFRVWWERCPDKVPRPNPGGAK